MKQPAATWFPAAAVVLLALAVYANSLPGAFILDDVPIVRDNPLVRNFDIATIIRSDTFGTRLNSGTYRPLTILSYAVNRALFGPGILSFHLVNVLLHAEVSFLLLLLLRRLPIGPGVAWLAAALFAVHPIHGEAVNTVVGRAELFVAVFTLLGLLAALGRGRRHLTLTALWYTLALLSKESAQSFLPLLFCVDAFATHDLRGTLRERRRLYTLLLVVTIVWLVLRTWALAQSNFPQQVINRSDNPVVGLALVPRLLTAGWIQLLYLRNHTLPTSLLGVYTTNYVGSVESFLSLRGAGITAAAAILAFLGVRGWLRRRGYALGMALYLAAFLVNLNVFLITFVAVADRLAYLPSIGFCLTAGALLLTPDTPDRLRTLRLGARAAAAGFLLLLSWLTIARNPAFSSSLRLWQETVRTDPRNGRGWFFLGDNLEASGRMAEADLAYRNSIQAEPEFPDSHIRYSHFLLKAGRPEEALRHAEEALRLVPGSIGPAQIRAAQALLALGRPGEALRRLDEIKSVYHSEITYLATRGKALDALGDTFGAIESFQRIAGDATIDPIVPFRLAELLIASGEAPEAEQLLRNRLSRVTNPGLYNLLGVALAAQGRHAEAAAAFEEAVRSSASGDPHAQPRTEPPRQRP